MLDDIPKAIRSDPEGEVLLEGMAQISALTMLLIEKGVFTIDEWEIKRAAMVNIYSDQEELRKIADEYAKRHPTPP